MEQFLRRLLLIVLCLIPFTSLGVTSTLLFPFVTGPTFIFRILVEIACGLWVAHFFIYSQTEISRKQSFLVYSLVAFLGVTALSDIFGLNPTLSIWGKLSRMDGLITLSHWIIYCLLLSVTIQSKQGWQKFLSLNVIAGLLISSIALLQFINIIPIFKDVSERRLDSTFGNASFLASYLLLTLGITFLLRSEPHISHLRKLLYTLSMGVFIFVIYFTATRGALITLVVVGGITACYAFYRLRKSRILSRQNYILTSVSIVVIIMIVVGTGYSRTVTHITLERFQRLAPHIILQESRIYLWQIGWRAFLTHPLLGWGQENYYYAYHQFYVPQLYNKQEVYSDRAHNNILDTLVNGGIIGLIVYLTILLSAYTIILSKKSSRISHAEKLSLTAFISAYIVNGLVTFDSLATYLPLFTILAYIQWTHTHNYLPTQTTPATQSHFIWLPISVITLTTIGIIYTINIQPLIASNRSAHALKELSLDGEKSYKLFTQALQEATFSRNDSIRQLVILVSNQERMSLLSPQTKKKFEDLAQTYITLLIQSSPPDPQLFYLAGVLAESTNNIDQAIILLKKAQQLSPNKQTILLKLVELLQKKHEYQVALALAKQVYESAPHIHDLQLAYASAALYAGKDSLVQSLLETIPGALIAQSNWLLRAYIETGHIDNAITLVRERLTLHPTDTQVYSTLAGLYYLNHDKGAAIRTLQKAIEVDEKFRPVGKLWIEQIQSGINPMT